MKNNVLLQSLEQPLKFNTKGQAKKKPISTLKWNSNDI